MIKRLEYNFFTGGQSADYLPSKKPSSPSYDFYSGSQPDDVFPSEIPSSPSELKVEGSLVEYVAKAIKDGGINKNKNFDAFFGSPVLTPQDLDVPENVAGPAGTDITATPSSVTTPKSITVPENVAGPTGTVENKSDAISHSSAASSLQPATAHVHAPDPNQSIFAFNNQIKDFLKDTLKNDNSETDFPYDLDHISNTTENLKFLQNDLQEDLALLFYLVLENELIILLFPPDDLIHHVVMERKPISRTEVNKLIYEYREKLSRANSDLLTEARGLYNLLIKPIKTKLDELKPKTLAIYQTGALRYMPFSALNDGEKYLIQDYAITTYLESTLLKIVNPNNSPSPEWSIASFGVTKQYETFSPLPAVEHEINAITQENITNKKYLNEEFTLSQLENAGTNQTFKVLHLATHFKLSSNDESSYLLAGDGENITLNNFNSLNLSTKELVTLSACETALGNLDNSVSGGKEVEGLALTVLKDSNAHSVLATLWNVADHTTAVLVEQFYQFRERENLSKAEALQKAQLHFINGHVVHDKTIQDERGISIYAVDTESHNDSTKHPYYWAPFILMGNWL